MAFLINHAEKIVAAIFAMVGLLALSSAHWSPTDLSHVELEDIAKQNESKIQLNEWPGEEKEWFTDVAEVLKITSQKQGKIVNVADFEIEAFNNVLTPATEKRSAVTVVTPEAPIATPVVFALAMAPEEDEMELAEATDAGGGASTEKAEEEMTEQEKEEALFAKRFGIKSNTAGAGGAEGYPGGGAGYPEGYGNEAGMEGYEEEYAGMDETYGGGEDYYTEFGQGLMVEEKNIGVRAGISVRMILDLRKQRSIIREALHLEGNYLVAQQHISYVDLVVERRLVGGEQSEWEEISSDDLGEILLTESLGVDIDIVSPAVTRASITMPLPRRAAGEWLPEVASHPQVYDFELSAKEKELMDKFNALRAKQIEEAEEARPIRVEPRGFSQFSQSATDMSSMYGMEYDQGYDQAYEEMESSVGEGGLTDSERAMLDKTKATADNRLLLVRFMDFTVARGRTYQYRARVAMKNPNYDFPLDELEDPALAQEVELTSPWSEPTGPVFLPYGHRTYVADVEARSGAQEKAVLSVFTDTTETGLSLLGNVKVPVGLPVFGNTSLEVVDLRTNSVDLTPVTLQAEELLTAAEELSRLNSSDHPDLKKQLDAFNKADRSAKPIPDQVCMVNSEGHIQLRSAGDRATQLAADRREYTGVVELYKKHWGKKEAAEGLAGLYGEGSEESYGGEGGETLGMSRASSSGYAATKSGRRLSSRELRRKQRSGEIPKGGAGAYGSEGAYEGGF